MLVIHQAILVPKMKVNLLGLMQLRDHGILVNDKPKHMVPSPTEDHHCIKIPGSKDKCELSIPLLIKGVFSYFPTWKPTMQEYEETPSDRVLELTSENVDWDPQVETRFEEQEEVMLSSARLPRKTNSMDATYRMVASSIPSKSMTFLSLFLELHWQELQFHLYLPRTGYMELDLKT